MGVGEDAEGFPEPRQVGLEFRRQPGPDLLERRAHRIVEDRSFELTQQVLAEGEGEDLVRGEGDVAHAEAVEEAVEDPAVALLRDHGKAGVHQRVQVAVDRATDTAEFVGQVVETATRPALREPLDELPLTGKLVPAHGVAG